MPTTLTPTASTPWYKLEPYDKGLPQAINESLLWSAKARERDLLRAAVLALAYERDYWSGDEITAWQDQTQRSGNHVGQTDEPSINQLMGSIDAVRNKVVQQPRITATTVNAPFEELVLWDARQRALNGILETPDAHEVTALWARDGLVKRIGHVLPRFDAPGGRITIQRLMPWQVHWDPNDAGPQGKPTFIHLVELVDREHFLAWYSGASARGEDGKASPIDAHEQRIADIKRIPRATAHIPGMSSTWTGLYQWHLSQIADDRTDRVRVVHSWRKAYRAGDPSSAGRYTCTVMGDDGDRGAVTAIDMPFLRDTLPIVHYVPTPTDAGLQGIALADSLLAVQRMIDLTMFRLSRVMRNYSHHKVFIGEDAPDSLAAAALSYGIQVVRVPDADLERGTLPQMVEPSVLSQQQLAWLRFLLDAPSSELGITQVVTQGVSQLGAGASGRAQVEEVMRSRDRQKHLIDQFGRARMRLARETLNRVEDAIAMDAKFAATFEDSRGLWVSRPWSQLTQNHDRWIIRLEETGRFGGQRSARISKIMDAALKGSVSPQTAFASVSGPADEESVDRMASAMVLAIERDMWVLSDPKGNHASAQPTQDMDLALAIRLTRDVINLARAREARPETVARYRQYLMAAASLLPPPAPIGSQGPPVI